MATIRNDGRHAALLALEAAVVSTRGGFACLFSSSDEYETALIAVRRAQGRYAPAKRNWWLLAVAVSGVALVAAGAVIFFA